LNNEYFTDNLSVETLAKLTDEMLNFEKKAKNRNLKKAYLFQIIPVAAAIVLVVGLVNVLPYAAKFDVGKSVGGDFYAGINDTAYASSEKISDDTVDTVISAIGELAIATPKGQEPIQNNDGTITLPGGGSYILENGTKFTVAGGTIIKSDGNIPGTLINAGKKITIEYSNGDVIEIDEDGTMRINGKTIEEFFWDGFTERSLFPDGIFVTDFDQNADWLAQRSEEFEDWVAQHSEEFEDWFAQRFEASSFWPNWDDFGCRCRCQCD